MPRLPDATAWRQLSSLLDELLELDEATRAQRLSALRAADPAQAAALDKLLAPLAQIDGGSFLDNPAALPDADYTGQRVGPYLLVREIGHGGMGTVWLAQRDDGRYDGQVAVKFVQLGLGSAAARERFRREGRILGRLSHPHIARLVDAGTTGADGTPYLVLEYVEGVPIDQHCRLADLDIRATLALMLDVLGAVAHAHARLTLHRDLKPSNILVSAEGGVKLLDFGIAKLLDDRPQHEQATSLTAVAGNPYTPLYAAPEQIEGGDVTTATDVYALGVLLYLLLGGGRHPTAAPAAPTLAQIRAAVEVTPPRLSDVAPPQRRDALRGDLDLIIAKALKKQPAERYPNAAALADDLRRWLAGTPIQARPDAAGYRLRMFVRRHRLGVAAGSTVLLALTVGAGVAAWQAVEARQQQAHAESLIEFMLGDLRTRLQPVGRLDVLDDVGTRALAYYAAQDQRRLGADALGQRARALQMIGEIADLRGRLPEAERVFAQAAATTAELLARAPNDGQRIFNHAQSVFWQAYMGWRQGRLETAVLGFTDYEALATRLVALDPGRSDWRAELAQAQVNLGTVLQESGQLQQAHARLLQASTDLPALVAQRPALAEDLANALGWLAQCERRLGRISAALGRLDALIALRQPKAMAVPPDLQALAGVATALSQQSTLELLRGDVATATARAQAALQHQQLLTAREPDNLLWQHELAWSRLRLAEALQHGNATAARAALAQAQAFLARVRQQAPEGMVSNQHLHARSLLLAAALHPADGGPVLADWLAAGPPLQGDAGLRETGLRAHLLLGDAAAALGQQDLATRHWTAAVAAGAQAARDEPLVAMLQARAHQRLGQAEQATALARGAAHTELRHVAYADPQPPLANAAGPGTPPRRTP